MIGGTGAAEQTWIYYDEYRNEIKDSANAKFCKVFINFCESIGINKERNQ